MKGRKRHIVVDTMGLLLAVVVHPADIQDRDGAKLVLSKLLGRFPRLHLIWADSAYAGQLVNWAFAWGGWLGRNRRLSKDYEELPESSETWVYIAMNHLMLKRLKPA